MQLLHCQCIDHWKEWRVKVFRSMCSPHFTLTEDVENHKKISLLFIFVKISVPFISTATRDQDVSFTFWNTIIKMPSSNTDLAETMPPTEILTSLASGHFPSSLIVKAELTALPRELLSSNCITTVLKRDERPLLLISPHDDRRGRTQAISRHTHTHKSQHNVSPCLHFIFSWDFFFSFTTRAKDAFVAVLQFLSYLRTGQMNIQSAKEQNNCYLLQNMNSYDFLSRTNIGKRVVGLIGKKITELMYPEHT